MSDATADEKISQAADLRLQGNTAFTSKDWGTAVEKYQQSIDLDGASKNSAKVYSNLAAALCKVSKYDEAHESAKMAIKVDPGWAKGHWRLGVVLELQKDFMYALKCYEDAVKLSLGSPDETTFKKAAGKMLLRLGYEGEDLPNGLRVTKLPPGSSFRANQSQPFYIAWDRLKKATDDLRDMEKGFPKHFNPSEDYISSEKWIAHGMYQWFSAMTPLLGEMINMPIPNPEIATIKLQLHALSVQKEGMSTEEYDARRFAITGCPALKGDEFQKLFNAMVFLSGDHIAFESGGGKFIPSPPWLTWHLPQQMVVMTMALYRETVWCMDKLDDKDMVVSPSIFKNQSTYFGNTNQASKASYGKEGSPQEVIDYCKKKLMEGITWDGGMRQFVSLIYQGTVFHGFQIRIMGQLGIAIKDFKWARAFITLADAEWKVSVEGDYEEKGECFRKSVQACVLSMELTTARTLRVSQLPTREEAEYEFHLAEEIINIAKNGRQSPDGNCYNEWMMDVAFRRKPLANACTYLAGAMNAMCADPKLLMEVIESTGVIEAGRDDNLYSFLDEMLEDYSTPPEGGNLNSLVAETYKHAAMSQLDDDNETIILWWGYAAHMSQAGGYIIGHLRQAINNAVDASRKRDSKLFGPEIWKGSTFQKQAVMLARYYECKTDDFVLPPIEFSPRPDGSLALFVDGQMLCMNFHKLMRSEAKRFEHNRPNKNRDAHFDTSEAEMKHGADQN